MMKVKLILVLGALIILTLAGCSIMQKEIKNTSLQNTNNEMSGKVESTSSAVNTANQRIINEEDFNINYKGVMINDKISFREIADKLGIKIGDGNHANSEIKAGCRVKGIDYSWYVVHYPSKEKEEMQIQYVINETLKKEYLVYVTLFTPKTYRDISVGDDEKKLIDAYGDSVKPSYNSPKDEVYYYKLDKDDKNTNADKTITIEVDRKSRKVISISINYNLSKYMKELDIVAFD